MIPRASFRTAPLAAFALVALSNAGCRQDLAPASRDVVLREGYALLRVDVPEHHEADVTLSIDDASFDESYTLLLRHDDPPGSVGWFDANAVVLPGCLPGTERDAAPCETDGAGRIVDRVTKTASRPAELTHFLERCDEDGACTHYVAVVAGTRTARRATLTVVTKRAGSADPATLRPIP